MKSTHIATSLDDSEHRKFGIRAAEMGLSRSALLKKLALEFLAGTQRLSEHPSEPCPNARCSPAPQSPTHSFPPVGAPEWKAEMQALAKANQSKAS